VTVTPEELADMQAREEISNRIINEVLNEAGIEELEGLTLEKRHPYDEKSPSFYMESDKDFLSRADNHRAAIILLGIYLRVKGIDA
jgi:hypothetical protein